MVISSTWTQMEDSSASGLILKKSSLIRGRKWICSQRKQSVKERLQLLRKVSFSCDREIEFELRMWMDNVNAKPPISSAFHFFSLFSPTLLYSSVLPLIRQLLATQQNALCKYRQRPCPLFFCLPYTHTTTELLKHYHCLQNSRAVLLIMNIYRKRNINIYLVEGLKRIIGISW